MSQRIFNFPVALLLDDMSGGGILVGAAIAKNKMSEGVSFHLRAPLVDGAHYFLLQNTCLDTNGVSINPFLEPLALPINYQP